MFKKEESNELSCPYCDDELKFSTEYLQYYCIGCGTYREPETEETYSNSPSISMWVCSNSIKAISVFVIISVIISMIPLFKVLLNERSIVLGVSDVQENWWDWPLETSDTESETGSSIENSSTIETVYISQTYVTEIQFTLTWVDEPDATIRHTNEPDEFSLLVLSPNGEFVETSDSRGIITIIIEFDYDSIELQEGTGTYEVEISLLNSGDHVSSGGSPFFRAISDSGNEWTLSYFYRYYKLPM